jgi:cephalosporin-C deacetylase
MILLLALALPASLAAAIRPPGGGRRQASSSQRPDGSVAVVAPGYRATVGPDGNLHSFAVRDSELLDDSVAISLGAFLYGDGPLKPGALTGVSPNLWRVAGQGCSVEYEFTNREIRISLGNTGARPLTYFMVLSADIAAAVSISTGEVAAAPATEAWPEVRFATAGGIYVELFGGTRIWGPWMGRQVWEVSRIRPGETAVVRVRGGVGGPPRATLPQLVGLTARVLGQDAITPAGRPVEVEAQVENRSDAELAGQVSLELSGCRSDLLVTAASPVKLPAKQSTRTSFAIPVQAPDFYTARLVLTVDGRTVGKATAAAGYKVSEIRPSVSRPDDFGEFWQRLLSEAGSGPPTYHLDPDERRSQEGIIAGVMEFEGLGGKNIYGWYLRPAGGRSAPERLGPDEAPARYPAILYLPVYGARPVTPPAALAKQGYVVLAPDVRGNAVNVTRPRAFEDYCTVGIASPESYVYREVVGQSLRALRLLATREEVDASRIAVVGMSEGGGVALMVAALAPEVKAVVADAPLLCDLPLSVQAAGWPYTSINRYLQQGPQDRETAGRTLSYFDVANFAPEVKCPVLMTVGFLDQVSLPTAAYGVFNLLAGPKEMRPLPTVGHEGGGEDVWNYKLAWLAKTLEQEPQAGPGESGPVKGLP